jgi:hypothetical protein
VDDVIITTADATDRLAIMDGIISTITFAYTTTPMVIFYATDIQHT